MLEPDTELQYKQQFIARVRDARAALGWKQWQMAEALGIPQDHYKHYEVLTAGKGRLLPHHLIGRFCLVAHVDPEWLVTGRGKKPLKPLIAVTAEPEPATKPKRPRARRAA